MPFLRFARDKRGVETTSLLYTVRRHGKGRPRLLYWFRSPSNVRVGRSALDENAIRQLEERHPEVPFDWPRILHASAAGSPSSETRDSRRESPRHEAPRADRRERAAPTRAAPAVAPPAPLAPIPEMERRGALEAGAGLISHDDLSRLRGRYSELLARITERVSDPQRAEALRLQAEALNPDAWVTPDEVTQGLEAFGANERQLREQLGARRRSRRGGARRRRKKGQPPGGPSSEPAA